ncbi:hypothetical protein [Micromonospora ureilytica]|uniref:hypothetical protein n=1 Tax=Micromonospora ureilytica TaxID=709868 RepID=UPI0040396CDD
MAANLISPAVPPGDLGHRLQLRRGEQWLYRVKGDPYAAALCGHDDVVETYQRIREQGPLFQSRDGTWVTGRYDDAAALLAHDDVEWQPVAAPHRVFTFADLVAGSDWAAFERRAAPLLDTAAVRAATPRLAALCARACGATGSRFDLVTDVAERLPVELLADLYALPPAQHERLARGVAESAAVLDSMVCPQRLEVSRRALAAVADLRQLFDEVAGGGRHAFLQPFLAVAGARLAAGLIARSVHLLVDDPHLHRHVAADVTAADEVVTRALRRDAPVRLLPGTAVADLERAGVRVPAGSDLVLVLAAANLDPDSAGTPLLPAGPYRLLLPIARELAGAAVSALAAAHPALSSDGAVVTAARAPVTQRLLRCPVRSGPA